MYCPQVHFPEFDNYVWPATLPGPSEQGCPNNQSGHAQWDCLNNGKWSSGYPDFR